MFTLVSEGCKVDIRVMNNTNVNMKMPFTEDAFFRLQGMYSVVRDENVQLTADVLTQVMPKSAIGIALAYTLSLWNRLNGYLLEGKYEIDNNLIETSIRPVALGREAISSPAHTMQLKELLCYTLFLAHAK